MRKSYFIQDEEPEWVHASCIASDAGGLPKIVEHGLNGSMLAHQQLQCLGDAVLECLDLDSKVRIQMGMAARERILAEFSPL